MAVHKVTITAKVVWFSIKLENNAFWVLPKDQELRFESAREGSIGAVVLRPDEVMLESSSSDSGDFNAELYVETDEVNLAVLVNSSGPLTINSGVASLTVDSTEGPNRLSLRLV